MPRRPLAAFALMTGCCAAVVAETVRTGARIQFPHAGISLAAPEGFEYEAPESPVVVMRAVRKANGKAAWAVTLMAFCVDQEVTAEQFVDALVAGQQETLAVRDLNVRKKVPMTVAGIKGTGRLMEYTFRGVKTLAAGAGFIRQGRAGGAPRICYVLLVESAELSPPKRTMLLAILGEVIKTVRMVPFRHPIDAQIRASADPLGGPGLGCSIRPPLGWYATVSDTGVGLGQTDYLLGGEVTLRAQVMSRSRPAGTISRQHVEECLRLARRRMEADGKVTVVSQGAAELAGRGGWQFVARLEGAAPTTASAPATSRAAGPALPPVFVVHRAVCADLPTAGDGPPQTVSYDLVLTATGPNTDAARAQAVMDRLAEGFLFAAAADVPRPATAPSSGSAEKKELAPPPSAR